MESILTPTQMSKVSWRLAPRHASHVKMNISKETDQYAYIEAIIDSIHEPILILDKQLLIQTANKALLRMLKIELASILGQTMSHQNEKNASMKDLIKRLKKLGKGNTSFEEFELTYPFSKIGERTMLINAKRITFEKKSSDFILLSMEDITQRKLVEQQKDDFVGYVTHELKTPITSLSAFLQLLQGYHEKTGDRKSQFLLAKAAGQLERLTKLLNAFSHVYKAQTGMLELQKETLDIYEIVRGVVEMFQYTTTTHMISIDGVVTTHIYADKERLRQVIINLLINAIKYSPDSDTIIVRLREEPQEVIVSVQDFGPGIPKSAQQRIFERFFRVKGTQGHNVKGLGLGLYIASEIIKAHKGKMWVESTEGKGATFSFSLPLTKKTLKNTS